MLKGGFSAYTLFTKLPGYNVSIVKGQQLFTNSLSLKAKTLFLRVGV